MPSTFPNTPIPVAMLCSAPAWISLATSWPLASGGSLSNMAAATTTRLDILSGVLDLNSFSSTLSQRSGVRGYNYFLNGYVHQISLCVCGPSEVDIRAKCYRSMRKSKPPHTLTLIVSGASDLRIQSSHCTCTAG